MEITIHCNCSFLKQLFDQLLYLKVVHFFTMVVLMMIMMMMMMIVAMIMAKMMTTTMVTSNMMIMAMTPPERLEETLPLSHSCIGGSSLDRRGCTYIYIFTFAFLAPTFTFLHFCMLCTCIYSFTFTLFAPTFLSLKY